jgi:hypothetical protein
MFGILIVGHFMALLLEVEECEKKLDTTYTAHSERCKK